MLGWAGLGWITTNRADIAVRPSEPDNVAKCIEQVRSVSSRPFFPVEQLLEQLRTLWRQGKEPQFSSASDSAPPVGTMNALARPLSRLRLGRLSGRAARPSRFAFSHQLAAVPRK